MQLPIQVTFRDIPPSEAMRAYVLERAAKLDTFCDHIMGCRIAIEVPHRHASHGKHFRVRVDLTVPGAELVAGAHAGDESRLREDPYAAADEAFAEAERLLHTYVQKRRGDVKPHAKQRRGRVTKLFGYEGFGFIETREGEEIYFHRNSVLNHAFDRLAIGAKVRFAEEMGEKGMQASTVALTH